MTEILYKELSYSIIGAAIEVHKTLGPGFLEVVYENALEIELKTRGVSFEKYLPLPVYYKDQMIGNYEADFLVDQKIILELKSISGLNKVHEAQAHHYLAATGLSLAILINFGTESLEYKRIIRNHPKSPS